MRGSLIRRNKKKHVWAENKPSHFKDNSYLRTEGIWRRAEEDDVVSYGGNSDNHNLPRHTKDLRATVVA
jgi:hypothetical protein